jgi:hypothetical protein
LTLRLETDAESFDRVRVAFRKSLTLKIASE